MIILSIAHLSYYFWFVYLFSCPQNSLERQLILVGISCSTSKFLRRPDSVTFNSIDNARLQKFPRVQERRAIIFAKFQTVYTTR